MVKLLRKQDGFIREMVSGLAVDLMKIKLPAIVEVQYMSYYKEIVGFQDVLLKNKEALSDLLKKLDDDPFNTELNINANHLKNEITLDIQHLRKGILDLYNLMNRLADPFVQEKKNMLDAIEDLEKDKNDFDSTLAAILLCGVQESEAREKISPTAKKLKTKSSSTLSISTPSVPAPSSVVLLSKTPTPPLATLQIVEDKIEDFLNTITQKYAQSMANPAERLWGGDIEVQLLGVMKNLKIYVHHATRNPDVLGADKAKQAIHLLYSNGNHYDVCNAEGVITQKTIPDGNCLFEAVIRAEKELSKIKTPISTSSMNTKISDLRKNIGEILLKNYAAIENGSAFHQPVGFKGEAVKLMQNDDVVWVRFKAVFEAENNYQLRYALSLLPDGVLKTEAQTLKRELDRFGAKESLEKIASPSLRLRKK
jgi:hypothetical protein